MIPPVPFFFLSFFPCPFLFSPSIPISQVYFPPPFFPLPLLPVFNLPISNKLLENLEFWNSNWEPEVVFEEEKINSGTIGVFNSDSDSDWNGIVNFDLYSFFFRSSIWWWCELQR